MNRPLIFTLVFGCLLLAWLASQFRRPDQKGVSNTNSSTIRERKADPSDASRPRIPVSVAGPGTGSVLSRTNAPPVAIWAGLYGVFSNLPPPQKDAPPRKESLIALYRNEPPGYKKRALGWALAFYSGEDIVELLTNTLFSTKGSLKGEALNSMMVIPQFLGLLAHDSDAAFDLVKRGIEPSFWDDKTAWESGEPSGRVKEVELARKSLQAFAYSGRAEVLPFLNELKSTPSGEIMAPMLVEAFFTTAVIRSKGFEAFKGILSDHQTLLMEFRAWAGTPAGIALEEWRASVRH